MLLQLLQSSRFPSSASASKVTFFASPSGSGVRLPLPPSFRCWRRMSTAPTDPVAAAAAASASASPVASDTGDTTSDQQQPDVIVQYVVLRRDLIDSWPLGSVVTQGCHASVAAVWSHRDHPDTTAYCSDANLDSMHKVTLEVKGEQQIRNLSEKLKSGGVHHKVWIEQPENIPTCIATRPYPKSQVASFFKKLKLCK